MTLKGSNINSPGLKPGVINWYVIAVWRLFCFFPAKKMTNESQYRSANNLIFILFHHLIHDKTHQVSEPAHIKKLHHRPYH